MKKSELLLREAIRGMLLEIDPNTDYGKSFSKVFLEPAKDSLKVIGSEFAKLSSKAQAATSILAKGILGLFLPGIEADYAKIFEASEKRSADIMARYPDAYRAVEGAMGKSWRLPFLIDPALTLSSVVAVKAPRVAIAAARIIAGRDLISSEMRQKVKANRELSNLWKQIQINEGQKSKGTKLVLEVATSENVQAFLSHPIIVDVINNSQMGQRMRRDGLTNAKQSAQDIVKKAKDNLEFKSLNDIEQKIGRSIDLAPIEDSPEEVDSILNVVVSQTREAVKKNAISTLQENIKKMNIDENSPLGEIYANAVKEITKL